MFYYAGSPTATAPLAVFWSPPPCLRPGGHGGTFAVITLLLLAAVIAAVAVRARPVCGVGAWHCRPGTKSVVLL